MTNYLVRVNVTTHVTAALMSRLPVPKPLPHSRAFDRLATLARSLASTGIDSNAGDYAELNAIAGAFTVTPNVPSFSIRSVNIVAIVAFGVFHVNSHGIGIQNHGNHGNSFQIDSILRCAIAVHRELEMIRFVLPCFRASVIL